MTPEAGRYLDRARQCLTRARPILAAGVSEDAGRTAYLAAFHSAQALIFERTGAVAKTHRAVRRQFAQLTRDQPRIDAELRRFLPDGYSLKSIADYEVGPDAVVPVEEAARAIEIATRFVDRIAELIMAADRPAGRSKEPEK
ncbi:MAG TPA: HEPN domain-containing protein [Stellaceae bacterium]|nr:HEPN domain-containing protein [Stellaceae bacterium]